MYMDVLNESLGAENGSKSCPESETFLPAHQLIQVKGGCENGSAVLILQCNYTINTAILLWQNAKMITKSP